jgi:uncharacterized protein YqfB (UPF0267 family)
VSKRAITVRDYELHEQPEFSIIRLAGVGAGAGKVGEIRKLSVSGTGSESVVEVIAVSECRFEELEEEHANAVLRSPQNTLSELKRILLELYRFRPTWQGDDTRLAIVRLRHAE